MQFDKNVLDFSYILMASSYFPFLNMAVAFFFTNLPSAKLSSASIFHASGPRSNLFNVTSYSTVAFGGIPNASLPFWPNANSGLIISLLKLREICSV